MKAYRITLLAIMSCSTAVATAIPSLGSNRPLTMVAEPEGDVAGGTLHGVITDGATKEPLIGATVRLEGTSLGGITDMDGKFTINGIPKGVYTVVISYVSYKTERIPNAVIEPGQRATLDFTLRPDDELLDEVVVTAKANRESESMLLLEQKRALIAIEAIGAMELDRKGISNAEAAVQQVSGISKQEGVKNVFVRGLADRYNSTYLNGFPIPSDDPEYKNISLDIFDTDMIQNIGVSKAFSSTRGGDVGGAAIDIKSKQLQSDHLLSIGAGVGGNATLLGRDTFLRQDGVDYFGFANRTQPDRSLFPGYGSEIQSGTDYPFVNKLQPVKVQAPVDHNLNLSLGKRLDLDSVVLDLLLVGRHEVGYSYSGRISRSFSTVFNGGTTGLWYTNQEGPMYDTDVRQLLLGDASMRILDKHTIRYTGLFIHSSKQFVTTLVGQHSEHNQDGSTMRQPDGDLLPEGSVPMELNHISLTRQQNNDNRLLINQLDTDWQLTDALTLNVGAAANILQAYEPDRRRLYMVLTDKGWIPDWSISNDRFFSHLRENDYNVKASVEWKFAPESFLTLGYKGRFIDHKFNSIAYNLLTTVSEGLDAKGYKELDWDRIYNAETLQNRDTHETPFSNIMLNNDEWYQALKQTHVGYLDAVWKVTDALTLQGGLRVDLLRQRVSTGINSDTPTSTVYAGTDPDKYSMKPFVLPSFNIRYDISDQHTLRLSASKSYSMPRFKEVSTYKYVNIDFTSCGWSKVRFSELYNVDLKYDWYFSPSELFTVTAFYKHIKDPLSRVFLAGTAGILQYANPADKAEVAGVELELRKDLLNTYSIATERRHKLSMGLRGSYLYSDMMLDLEPFGVIKSERTELEGASPWLANADLTYSYSNARNSYTGTILFDYFSDRLYTYGTVGQNENGIIEKGIAKLNLVGEANLGKHFSIKMKVNNLLNSPIRKVEVPGEVLQKTYTEYYNAHPELTAPHEPDAPQIISEYRKGVSFSLSVGYKF